MVDLCLSTSSCNFSRFKTLLYLQFAGRGTAVKWFELGRGGWNPSREHEQLVQEPGKDLPRWWWCKVKFEEQSVGLSCKVVFCPVAAVLPYRNKDLIPWSQCASQDLSFIFLDPICFDKRHEIPVKPLPSFFTLTCHLLAVTCVSLLTRQMGGVAAPNPFPCFIYQTVKSFSLKKKNHTQKNPHRKTLPWGIFPFFQKVTKYSLVFLLYI